jgi:uncharacterized membrane protein
MQEGLAGSSSPTTNVGTVERWSCGLLGGLLLVYGATRKSWGRYALLGTGLALAYRGVRGHCRLYGALGIDTADRSASATTAAAVTVERSQGEVYAWLKRPDCLPLLTDLIQELRMVNPSEYEARAPANGQTVPWRVAIMADRENEFIAWRAFAGGRPGHTGQIALRPAPGHRGTEVEVQIQQEGAASPAGVIADRAAALSWRSKVSRALNHLKQLIEAGEIASTAGQPAGQRSLLGEALSLSH